MQAGDSNLNHITEIIFPNVRRLLTEDELERIAIVSDDGSLERFTAEIQACGETFRIPLSNSAVSETVAEARQRFYDELQDAIAESRFGWGQLRE